MMKSRFMRFVLFLAIFLFSPVLVQAGMPLNNDGTVPAAPFQNLQNQIDAIPAGADGADGTNGTNGEDGSSCSISGTTVSCTDGTSENVQGLQGVPGNDGNDGEEGPLGPAGPTGGLPVGVSGIIFARCVLNDLTIEGVVRTCDVEGAAVGDAVIVSRSSSAGRIDINFWVTSAIVSEENKVQIGIWGRGGVTAGHGEFAILVIKEE